jgi:hypothetical protein
MKAVLFIDFENVQSISLAGLDRAETKIVIFVGKSQNKVPMNLVKEIDSFTRHDWVQISGDGKNNLDFHLAFEMGRLLEETERDAEFIVLSKDHGYDALIDYIRATHEKPCRRVNNLSELPLSKVKALTSLHTPEVLDNLRKIDPKKLPRTLKTLRKHVESAFKDKFDSKELDAVIEELFTKDMIYEVQNRINYRLNPQAQGQGGQRAGSR